MSDFEHLQKHLSQGLSPKIDSPMCKEHLRTHQNCEGCSSEKDCHELCSRLLDAALADLEAMETTESHRQDGRVDCQKCREFCAPDTWYSFCEMTHNLYPKDYCSDFRYNWNLKRRLQEE